MKNLIFKKLHKFSFYLESYYSIYESNLFYFLPNNVNDFTDINLLIEQITENTFDNKLIKKSIINSIKYLFFEYLFNLSENILNKYFKKQMQKIV